MFLRIALVRAIVVLFLVYALSPLTSAFPVRQGAPQAPFVRLLLLDIVITLTAQPDAGEPAGETGQPLELLLKKRRAVLRKPPIDLVPPLIVPAALSATLLVEVPSASSRSSVRTHDRVPLAGARLPYVGLSPPA